MNSNTEGLKCNSVPFQRRFLSMSRNQSLWTGVLGKLAECTQRIFTRAGRVHI